MIEHVVGFDAKLNIVLSVFAVLNLPEQRHVPVTQPGATNGVDPGVVSDAALRRRPDTARVDVSENRTVAARLVWIASQDDARRKVLAAGDQAVQSSSRRDVRQRVT